MPYRVAYYAHHHGRGHLQHARDLIATTSHDVLVLSSEEFDDSEYKDRVTSTVLLSDVVEGYGVMKNKPYHYLPESLIIRERSQRLLTAPYDFKPDVVIVDVSVEVASFIKLAGYPVIYRLMHGDRTDSAHQNIYSVANRLIAYFPETLQPISLSPTLLQKTNFTGMLTPTLTSLGRVAKNKRSITVLTSSGEYGVRATDVRAAALQTPDWTWTIVGKLKREDSTYLPSNCHSVGFAADPDYYLAQASIIVCSGGHNAVARSIAHKRPLIITPEDRPYMEQLCFAQELSHAYAIPYVASWQDADWVSLLESTSLQNPAFVAAEVLRSPQEYGHTIDKCLEQVINTGL